MGRSAIGRSSSVMVAVALLVGGSGVVMPSSVSAAQRWPPGGEAIDFDGLMVKAEEQRSAGEHAAAARSYAAAYRALPEEEHAGLMGELAVDNALVDYDKAFEQQPQELALLEEPAALLEEYIAWRTKAHEAGRAEVVPLRLEQELARLNVDIELARAEAKPAEPEPLVEPTEPTEPTEPVTNRNVDVAIFVSGIASVVAGAALAGGGAWNFSKIKRQEQARLIGLEQGQLTVQAREEYRTELTEWVDQKRATATGLVVEGSVLAAVGIGLTVWGAVRMRRRGRGMERRVSVGVPIVSRERIGAVVTVGF